MRLSLVPKEQDYFRLFSDLAANLDETAQLPARDVSDYEDALDDSSASGAVTVSMSTVDRDADNDATAEMEIEGGTINTKAR